MRQLTRAGLVVAAIAMAACTNRNVTPVPVPNGQPTTVLVPPPEPIATTPDATTSNATENEGAAAATSETTTTVDKQERTHARKSMRKAKRAHREAPAAVERPADQGMNDPVTRPIESARSEGAIARDEESSIESGSTSNEPAASKMHSKIDSSSPTGTEWQARGGADTGRWVDSNEPSTMIPTHVGSTGLSGEDAGFAMTGHRGVFDPAKLHADARSARIYPIGSRELQYYQYGRKGQFKAAMKARLAGIDSKIDEIGARVQGATGPTTRAQYRDMLATVEQDRDVAVAKLRQADAVAPSRWDGYKVEFRDSVAELERSYLRLDAAMR